MAAKPKEYKRLNRAVSVVEALANTLDPALKKRGFASRDLVTHWAAIAPPPYSEFSRPDKLSWPRGEKRADGATLFLRCAPSHRLALMHEGPQVAAAINSYFGFVVVAEVRISPQPFERDRSAGPVEVTPSPLIEQQASGAVSGVSDPDLRDALQKLALGVFRRGK